MFYERISTKDIRRATETSIAARVSDGAVELLIDPARNPNRLTYDMGCGRRSCDGHGRAGKTVGRDMKSKRSMGLPAKFSGKCAGQIACLQTENFELKQTSCAKV